MQLQIMETSVSPRKSSRVSKIREPTKIINNNSAGRLLDVLLRLVENVLANALAAQSGRVMEVEATPVSWAVS
jgi:hypothetical protein